MPRAFLKAREPFSSYSHFIGAVLSGAGLFVLLVRLLFDSSVTGSLAAAAVVFCLSLIALYSASSVYHFSGRGEAVLRRLKKLDHSMIYVLIAGSYTPIILKFMPAPRSYVFLSVIWLIALTVLPSSCCGLTRRVSSAPRCTSRSAGRSRLISELCCPCPRLPLPCWLPEVCRIRSAA